MERLQFSTTINAPREKVWQTLWSDDTYPQWTAPFSPTGASYAKTDWQQGSKVIFGDDSGSGMLSRIAEKRPNEYMSFEHLGEVKDGVEDTTSERVSGWAGAHENYTLRDVNGQTEVFVESDITEEYKEMFEKIWPQALNRLKEISES